MKQLGNEQQMPIKIEIKQLNSIYEIRPENPKFVINKVKMLKNKVRHLNAPVITEFNNLTCNHVLQKQKIIINNNN